MARIWDIITAVWRVFMTLFAARTWVVACARNGAEVELWRAAKPEQERTSRFNTPHIERAARFATKEEAEREARAGNIDPWVFNSNRATPAPRGVIFLHPLETHRRSA